MLVSFSAGIELLANLIQHSESSASTLTTGNNNSFTSMLYFPETKNITFVFGLSVR